MKRIITIASVMLCLWMSNSILASAETYTYDELNRITSVTYENGQSIDKYIHYYNNKRIKVKLTGMSPVEYRTQTSQTAA